MATTETISFSEHYIKQLKRSQQLRISSAQERVQKLGRLAKAIRAHEAALIAAMWEDFKKPSLEVQLTELAPLYLEINHFKKKTKSWMKPRRVANAFPFLLGKSVIHHEPKGVVLIIAPWNYPFNLALTPLVAAIAAGNCVSIKPSEFTPKTAGVIKSVIESVFEPEEVAVFEGGIETSKALLELPFHHIFFTGSTAVGKEVMKAAAVHLSDITLELGGKSPAIIDESADLRQTAEKLLWGKFLNAGQTCIAPDYVLMNDQMIEKFTEELRQALASFANASGKLDMAHLVSPKHFKRMQLLVEDAVLNGAKVAVGGQFDADELHITPTVLINVRPDMAIMQEEIFGPVLPILGVAHTQEAIAFVNQHDKPLALYIFSQNDYKTSQIIQETSSGGVCINDVVVHITNPNLPFGGVNHSGIGNYHGFAGFKTFSHEKSVFHQFTWFNLNKILYPPYHDRKAKWIQWLMKIIR